MAAEKTRLESEVKRLNKEIVLEEKAKERRREAFVRGLEQQLAEKKTDQLSDRKHEEAEAFKRDNELAAKLAQWNISEEEVITVSFTCIQVTNMRFLTLTQVGLIFHK